MQDVGARAGQIYVYYDSELGHSGSIWCHNMPMVVCYVYPQHYTKAFLDNENLYTLSFYPEKYKNKLA